MLQFSLPKKLHAFNLDWVLSNLHDSTLSKDIVAYYDAVLSNLPW